MAPKAIRVPSALAATDPGDWVLNKDKQGNVTGFLRGPGCQKVAPYFDLHLYNWKPTVGGLFKPNKVTGDDGEYGYEGWVSTEPFDYEPDPDGTNDGFTDVTFPKTRTYARFKEFAEVARRRGARGEETWMRANQNALIVAGLVAVGIDPYRPEITDDVADWAIKLVTWSNECWAERLRHTASGEDPYHRDSAKVLRIIGNPQKYADYKNVRANARLCLRDGLMPKGVLLTRSKMLAVRLDQILDTLIESEQIGQTEVHDNDCYFIRES